MSQAALRLRLGDTHCQDTGYQVVKGKGVGPHQGAATTLSFIYGNVIFSPSGSESMSLLCSVRMLVKGVHGNELSPIKSQKSKMKSSGPVASSVNGLSVLPVKHSIQK